MKGAHIGRIEVMVTEKKLFIIHGENVAIFERDVCDEIIEALVVAKGVTLEVVGDDHKDHPHKQPFKLPEFPDENGNVIRDADGTPIAARDPITKKMVRFEKREPRTQQENEALAKVHKIASGVKNRKGKSLARQRANGSSQNVDDITPLHQIVSSRRDAWPVLENFLRKVGRPCSMKEIMAHMQKAGYKTKTPDNTLNRMLAGRIQKKLVRRISRGVYELIL